jgi:hypothetical protein
MVTDHPNSNADEHGQGGAGGDRREQRGERPEEDAAAEDGLAAVGFARPAPQHLRAGVCVRGSVVQRVSRWSTSVSQRGHE